MAEPDSDQEIVSSTVSWSIHRIKIAQRGPSRGAGCGRVTVTDGPSVAAPLEDHLAMLLKGVQARLQSMKHRGGAIGLLSLLDQLVNDLFLPSNTLLGDRNVSLGLGKVVLLKALVHGGKP
jgi:hypothetical protein